MPISKWIEIYKQGSAKLGSKDINLALVAIKAQPRPDQQMRESFVVALEALKEVKAKNIAFVFTWPETLDMNALEEEDEDDPDSKEFAGKPKWEVYLSELTKKIPSALDGVPPKDINKFFFSFEDGKTGKKTTQDELLQWLAKVSP